MGKKGSWISALKRVFTSTPKDKLVISGPDREFVKEKKRWAIGKLRHGGTKPFINLHKELSSIEKILGDAEREHHRLQHDPETSRNKEPSSIDKTLGEAKKGHHKLQHHAEPPKKAQHQSSTESTVGNDELVQAKPLPMPPKIAQQPKVLCANPIANASQTATTSPSRTTLNYAHKSAVRIQAAYKGYMARKSYRALRGLVRLQGLMRGQSVKRQTMNALRLMQVFVRVQHQVRMRRIQAMESQNPQRQTPHSGDKEQDSNISKWSLSHKSDAEEQIQEEWDSSLLTKEEMDARMQKKVEAAIKRERALAYATSNQQHQPLKAPPLSPRAAPAGPRNRGGPVWWGWLERQFQLHHPAERAARPATPPAKASVLPTTPKELDARTRPSNRGTRPSLVPEDPELCTPRSSHAAATTKPRPQSSSPRKARNAPASCRAAPRDDAESLTSCPAYTAPGYMAPTLSAKAKVREQAFQREAPAKKRFSFGLSQSIGALRWSKGGSSSLMATKEASSAQRPRGQHRPTHSAGNLSVDSAASLPVGVGRKPYK